MLPFCAVTRRKGNVKREIEQVRLPFPCPTKINEEKSAKPVAFVNEPCYTECVIGNQDFL